MRKLPKPASKLSDLVPYDPKYLPARVYLNANENPYGLPKPVLTALAESVSRQSLNRYPDPLAKGLRPKVAAFNAVGEGNVLLGNGGDELIFNIMLAYGGADRKLLIAPPSFSSYELDARLTDTRIVEIPRIMHEGQTAKGYLDTDNLALGDADTGESVLGVDEGAILDRVERGDIDVVMLASPNNPTGDALSLGFISELLEACDGLVLIDQAYVEFSDKAFDAIPLLSRHKNLAVLRTFSKAFALAGVRLGYLLASEEVVAELCKVRQPYSVDTFSAYAGSTVLDSSESFQTQIAEIINERRRVASVLRELPGVTVFASEANFILFKVDGAQLYWQRLYDEESILLRDFSSAPYLKDCLRVSMGTPGENDEFLASMREMLGGRS